MNEQLTKALHARVDAETDQSAIEDESEPFEGAPGHIVRERSPHAVLSADLALLQDLQKAKQIQIAILADRRVRNEPMMRMSREGEVPTGKTFAEHAEAVLPDVELDIAELIARIVPAAKRLGVRLPSDLANMHREGTITGTGM